MALDLNFNRLAKELPEGKRFEVNFTQAQDGQFFNYEVERVGEKILFFHGSTQVYNVRIFRDKATILDIIALALRRAGKLTSKTTYKADLLLNMWDGYTEDTTHAGLLSYYGERSATLNRPTEEKPYYIGVELEVESRNREAREALTNFRSNMWRVARDGSLSAEYGLEFISDLIAPSDAIQPKTFEPLCNILQGLATSRTSDRTGLHVHVSRPAGGETEQEQIETIAKIILMQNEILSQSNLAKLYGREKNRWSANNITTDRSRFVDGLKVVKEHAPNVLKDAGAKAKYIQDLTPHNKEGHTDNRYRAVNLTNEHTIEFRQGKGHINSTHIATIIQHIITLFDYCKATKIEKLSEHGYIKSIPNAARYAHLKSILKGEQE